MFTVYSENDPGSTQISNLFIDQYMNDANDAQLKVYLYLLRMMNAGRTTSISDMAEQFNHTERDVTRSLHYWEDRGLIALEYSGIGEITAIHMITPKADRAALKAPLAVPVKAPALPRLQPMAIPGQSATPSQNTSSLEGGNADAQTATAVSRQPETAPRQSDAASVEAFRSSAKRAQLLFVIEQYIGKPLAPSEVESVYYISEQLHFSDALIDYLLQYCIDRGKKDFRYIEKVAVNWAEHGITTPKQAERAASGFGKNRRGYAGVKPSSNPFNQFEQNQYDFDQLEQEILGN